MVVIVIEIVVVVVVVNFVMVMEITWGIEWLFEISIRGMHYKSERNLILSRDYKKKRKRKKIKMSKIV